MAIFEVYMDATGTHDGSPAIGVGSILGRQSVWGELMPHWDAALEKHDARDLKGNLYFHASELACFGKNFSPERGWCNRKRDALVSDLLDVFELFGRSLEIVGYVFSGRDFSQVSEELGNTNIRDIDLAYEIAFSNLVHFKELMNSENPNAVTETAIIIEDGPKEQKSSIINVMKQQLDLREMRRYYGFGNLKFSDKVGMRQLGLADLFAYEAFKYVENAEIQSADNDLRYPLKRLKQCTDCEICYYNVGLLRMALTKAMKRIGHKNVSS